MKDEDESLRVGADHREREAFSSFILHPSSFILSLQSPS
jgi:hypothetical protein